LGPNDRSGRARIEENRTDVEKWRRKVKDHHSGEENNVLTGGGTRKNKAIVLLLATRVKRQKGNKTGEEDILEERAKSSC